MLYFPTNLNLQQLNASSENQTHKALAVSHKMLYYIWQRMCMD